MRVLCNNGFYGLLLMHAAFGLDETVGTAATDGNRIMFCPSFLETLSDGELDFVLMHEILHIALKHCNRTGKRDNARFNIACDIVVNSNILKSNGMNLKSITLLGYGPLMHLTPDGEEGYKFTAEEVYEMLKTGKSAKQWDSHAMWGEGAAEEDVEKWESYVQSACEAIQRQDAVSGKDSLPAFAERMIEERRSSQVNWRILLNDFVQENFADYSFSPPDKRFDGPFFLPDFNETEKSVFDVLFLVDASGSMLADDVALVFAEVRSAVEMFGGKLSGWIGFFDAIVYGLTPFYEGLPKMKAKGGGGTSFKAVFDYIFKRKDISPSCIVILTDGYAPFPSESAAQGIPVLWVVKSAVKPPWGKTVRLK